ncbi:hypothetical protein SEA_HOLLIDAY_91 [Gordonia phage Holliday]|nr:hypothetical protein SEA_HOLLIDAY_91 [Gordonia phage Holliday]
MSDEKRIDTRSDGTEFRWYGDVLDEIVAHNVKCIHFEQMGDAQFWMSLELANGEHWHVNFGANNPRVKGYSFAEDVTTRGER